MYLYIDFNKRFWALSSDFVVDYDIDLFFMICAISHSGNYKLSPVDFTRM